MRVDAYIIALGNGEAEQVASALQAVSAQELSSATGQTVESISPAALLLPPPAPPPSPAPQPPAAAVAPDASTPIADGGVPSEGPTDSGAGGGGATDSGAGGADAANPGGDPGGDLSEVGEASNQMGEAGFGGGAIAGVIVAVVVGVVLIACACYVCLCCSRLERQKAFNITHYGGLRSQQRLSIRRSQKSGASAGPEGCHGSCTPSAYPSSSAAASQYKEMIPESLLSGLPFSLEDGGAPVRAPAPAGGANSGDPEEACPASAAPAGSNSDAGAAGSSNAPLFRI